MSEHTSRDGANSKASEPSTATPTQHEGSNQAQEPVRGHGRDEDGGDDAASQSKETDTSARKPVQLKSHFRGMPKDWPINRSKYLPTGSLQLESH
ncbi:hypothetical protein PFICI_15154 [Pestalotiopsis fici W106-1]|uniref:Uncharacterized protein n=1 Tax=Pestalotiopsis fici (strain W106-1 / CGMCC3.15140) TaxID=1229662 RepID=W3WHE8_PESFW|nr:uncharacterized protein PFICI_15154 [Pestalotiopsis fici W106-1]ETS73209.1 hypothetical protein PFICI_15154 [Pestalotiopsis fici W106-1]